ETRLPLFLPLDEHARGVAGPSAPLATLAQRRFGDRDRFPALRPPAGFFDAQLGTGRCLVLLDGLDAFPDESARARAIVWIEEQVERYPESRLVIAASLRPDGTPPLSRARTVELLPLSD